MRTGSYSTNAVLVNYFTQYPLFSSKRLNYNDYEEAYRLTLAKKHHGKQGNPGLVRLAELKSQMNLSRKLYT